MKKPFKSKSKYNFYSKLYLFVTIGPLMVYFSLNSMMALKKPLVKLLFFKEITDTSVTNIIKERLNADKSECYYPQSVKRFYEQNGNKLIWIAPDTVKTHASAGMLLLDCVLQFGLNYADYHPHYLTYNKLTLLTQRFSEQSNSDKAGFDIMLTDALITYMNHLHYGKLNPDYAANKIDNGNINGFDAVAVLSKALTQKDFMSAVLSVQPQSMAYKKLQYHLHLLTGLYTGDCYEIPDSMVRKIAINMERLRWIDNRDRSTIEVNIPSSTLVFNGPDTSYNFKVIVGQPGAPTPILQSAISYFTSGHQQLTLAHVFPTDFIVLYFPNLHADLNDVSKQQSLNNAEGTAGYSSIKVEHAEQLADILLKNDGNEKGITEAHIAIKKHQYRVFQLKNTVTLSVTYLTCEVKGGILITYPDVYNLDKGAESALYNKALQLSIQRNSSEGR